MNSPKQPPSSALSGVRKLLTQEPVFIAGSCVAAESHNISDYADLDIFTPTKHVLISTVQKLLDNGYTMDERFSRVWYRWLRYGFKGWHTNSMKLHDLNDLEVNVVFKVIGGQPTSSLAQVLESFDFGLLATGYDMEDDIKRDLRGYLFPGYDLEGPLPMMPNKRSNWIRGYISQYNGLREAARYAKYHTYGYDLSLVKQDLITGYESAALYYKSQFDKDKKLLGEIYSLLAVKIDDDEIQELKESYEQLDFNDPLDEIMAALD